MDSKECMCDTTLVELMVGTRKRGSADQNKKASAEKKYRS